MSGVAWTIGSASSRRNPSTRQSRTSGQTAGFRLNDPLVVANTHAFLAANLSRESLWKTPLVNKLKQDIYKGWYEQKEGMADPNKASLPQMVSVLRDPPKGTDLYDGLIAGMRQPRWARDPMLFDDTPRNREKRTNAEIKRQMATKMSDRMGPWDKGIVRPSTPTENGEPVYRKTRFPDETRTWKGATWLKPMVTQSSFDFDHYPYDRIPTEGFAAMCDPWNVNFGGGTSGSVPNAVLCGVYLGQDTIASYAQYRAKRYGLTTSQADTQAKTIAERELATAAIANWTNEGHHALVECVLPFKDAMGLELRDQPPENVLIQQIMPPRLKTALAAHVDQWIAEQFSGADVALGKAVKARLKRSLG